MRALRRTHATEEERCFHSGYFLCTRSKESDFLWLAVSSQGEKWLSLSGEIKRHCDSGFRRNDTRETECWIPAFAGMTNAVRASQPSPTRSAPPPTTPQSAAAPESARPASAPRTTPDIPRYFRYSSIHPSVSILQQRIDIRMRNIQSIEIQILRTRHEPDRRLLRTFATVAASHIHSSTRMLSPNPATRTFLLGSCETSSREKFSATWRRVCRTTTNAKNNLRSCNRRTASSPSNRGANADRAGRSRRRFRSHRRADEHALQPVAASNTNGTRCSRRPPKRSPKWERLARPPRAATNSGTAAPTR